MLETHTENSSIEDKIIADCLSRFPLRSVPTTERVRPDVGSAWEMTMSCCMCANGDTLSLGFTHAVKGAWGPFVSMGGLLAPSRGARKRMRANANMKPQSLVKTKQAEDTKHSPYSCCLEQHWPKHGAWRIAASSKLTSGDTWRTRNALFRGFFCQLNNELRNEGWWLATQRCDTAFRWPQIALTVFCVVPWTSKWWNAKSMASHGVDNV